ncbi:hypothetical protein AGMMS49992_20600 [Clostridia bacterium]|nr:hypothetical protein AGMMS49992_20600 [Clostridia bacterium]
MKRSGSEPHPYMVLASTKDMARDQWLNARRKGIGGSDAAAVMGVSPYRSAYTVWADKLGLGLEPTETEAMRSGRDLEGYVASRFHEETRLRVERRHAIYQSTEYPWMLANIDRWVPTARCGLECKTSRDIRLERFKNGDYPIEYYTQCTHYMAVTGARRWFLAVLVYGTEFKIFEVERDEADVAALVEAERTFWHEHVLMGIAPSADGSDSTKATLGALYPTDDGALKQARDDSILAELYAKKQVYKALEGEIQTLTNTLKDEMGTAKYLAGAEYTATWRTQADNHLDKDALLKAYPDIDIDKCMKHGVKRCFCIKKEHDYA